ncbi:hypothetical protein Pogu_2049 [Pyrobaculum oguniense TE7]|uniref:Uncharacterized protein n=1 Tax=Pyrobaculum oguniense (strain DSM 13380 / JCM 10595 / TE7) TaxID=698757 RepID=H6QB79_PYROT|nr:hypothetical protein Pogu_2049 [Pyrobaculum oguniense TE7]
MAVHVNKIAVGIESNGKGTDNGTVEIVKRVMRKIGLKAFEIYVTQPESTASSSP